MKEIFNNWLIRQQSTPKRSNFQLDESLRPFGYPFFPEEVTEKQIVLSTLSSSGYIFLKWLILLFAIMFMMMAYSFHQHIGDILYIIGFIGFSILAFYPSSIPEIITISPLGIWLTNHIFVFKNIITIPRNEIVQLYVQEKERGIYYSAIIYVKYANNKTKKLFPLIRKNHKEMVEDSQIVIGSIRKMLSV